MESLCHLGEFIVYFFLGNDSILTFCDCQYLDFIRVSMIVSLTSNDINKDEDKFINQIVKCLKL